LEPFIEEKNLTQGAPTFDSSRSISLRGGRSSN
jgi:hypothetical protein